jgi:hypothetical protein
MMAGAPGARASLVILISSGKTGWNPIPALAVRGANIQNASPIATHLHNLNIVVSFEVNARSTDESRKKIPCRREPRTPGGRRSDLRGDSNSASSESWAPSSQNPATK